MFPLILVACAIDQKACQVRYSDFRYARILTNFCAQNYGDWI